MAVDLFSLRMNIETSGLAQAKSGLEQIELAGRDATLGATNFANAWEVALLKFKGTAAQLAAFKTEFSAGFFNEKLISGMSLAGQEAAKAGEGAAKWAAGLKNIEEGAPKAAAGTSLLGNAMKGFMALAVPFVEIWAAFKIFDFVHDTIEGAAALHELSQKTGATVEMLSMLQFAGKRASVSTEEITVGFRGMALALGRLRDGQERTVEGFKKIGLSAGDFVGLSADQAFEKIALAVGRMKDETLRAEVAQIAFGRSGTALIPLLEDLARNGFAKTREEAEKNGGIISKQQAEQADKFTDAIGDLGKALGGLMREVLIPILPMLAAFVGFLAAAVKHVKDLATGGVANFGFNLGRELTGERHEGGDWEATDLGPTKGAGQRNRGQGIIALPPAIKEKAHEAAAAHVAKAIEDMKAPASLSGGGPLTSSMGVRGGSFAGTAQPGAGLGPGESLMDALKQQLYEGLERLMPFQQALAGFFQNVFATGKIGASIKNFGKSILAGMGSIFSQMAAKAILAAPLFQAIGAAMHNPFTAGAALLAFGIALSALGNSMGGSATGEGGGSGGGIRNRAEDRTTQIHLTSDGAGGFKPVEAKPAMHFTVIGPNDPAAQRGIKELIRNADRRGL